MDGAAGAAAPRYSSTVATAAINVVDGFIVGYGQWKGNEKEIVSAVFWMILLFRERIVESFDRPVSVRRPLGPPRSPRSPFPGHSRYVYDVPVMPPERPDTPALESRACVRVRKAANQLFFARLTGRWGGKGLAPQLRLVYMCVAAGVERLG